MTTEHLRKLFASYYDPRANQRVKAACIVMMHPLINREIEVSTSDCVPGMENVREHVEGRLFDRVTVIYERPYEVI